MATTTPNLGLKKPNVTDKVNVSDLNGNADLLDAIIGRLSNLNTTQKDSLVAAINEALTSAGTTPNIQIGVVETLPAGSQATASMSGTVENPLLNLGIPQGIPGHGGGGSISVEDDGAGNVEITVVPSGWIVTDDGNGNVVIGGST